MVEAKTFELKTPMLKQGTSHKNLAGTDLMGIALKVYAEGGENGLHTHPGEDHSFIILEGEMTLYDKDEKVTILKRGHGIMIPTGWYYWFKSSGGEPLVFLKLSAYNGKVKVEKGSNYGKLPAPGVVEQERPPKIPIDGSYWTL